jgi:hypothetical protein
VLEIDIEREQTSLYGMLPGGDDLQDKWAGGVLAPNGRIYGIPWRSSSVLEFDPMTKAIALLGSTGSGNFSWSGGVVANSGRIVAVPYNGAWVLEIGESVCSTAQKHPPAVTTPPLPITTPPLPMRTASPLGDRDPAPGQARSVAGDSIARSDGLTSLTFVLALLGCPEAAKASEDACFHLSHRTWHSAMVTIMRPESTLLDIREQVLASRLSHVPTNFCFLFNGHALDPNVEGTIKAASVAVITQPDTRYSVQRIVLIDNTNCNIESKVTLFGSIGFSVPFDDAASVRGKFRPVHAVLLMLCMTAITFVACSLIHCKSRKNRDNRDGPYYDRVPASEPQEAQALIVQAESANSPDAQPVPHLQARWRPVLKPTRPLARARAGDDRLIQPGSLVGLKKK